MQKFYNKRICEHCGSEFRPRKAGIVTCCKKCHQARERYLAAQSKTRSDPVNIMIDWLNYELEKTREIMRIMLDERSALKAEITRLTEDKMRLAGEKAELQGEIFFEDMLAQTSRKFAANG